jgi:hypothetical protein
MPGARLSQLQKRILRWLVADHQRTQGRIMRRPQELVRALQRDKGNSSRSFRPLEGWGWIVLGHSSGGKAESLMLSPTGRNGPHK